MNPYNFEGSLPCIQNVALSYMIVEFILCSHICFFSPICFLVFFYFLSNLFAQHGAQTHSPKIQSHVLY